MSGSEVINSTMVMPNGRSNCDKEQNYEGSENGCSSHFK